MLFDLFCAFFYMLRPWCLKYHDIVVPVTDHIEAVTQEGRKVSRVKGRGNGTSFTFWNLSFLSVNVKRSSTSRRDCLICRDPNRWLGKIVAQGGLYLEVRIVDRFGRSHCSTNYKNDKARNHMKGSISISAECIDICQKVSFCVPEILPHLWCKQETAK